ncbi:hypothetical protein KCU73_g856, partial [Aureobasidium melanogenum]
MSRETAHAKSTLVEHPALNVAEPLSEAETCDIIPSRRLTAKEAEQDYQNQLALLAQQNKGYDSGQSNRFRSSQNERGIEDQDQTAV